jgi:glyoxalase family protein
MQPVQGIHHITAFAKDPQQNVDFYHHVLGQRLVKTTVNFDDPGTYHLYYGDEIGTPGTIMTFFPWQHARKGVHGNGEVNATAYTIRPQSVNYWLTRLAENGVAVGEAQTRFGQTVYPFADPEGLKIEFIVSDEPATIQHWQAGGVPADHAIRGFHGATLWVNESATTGKLLTDDLGFSFVGQEGSRYRYKAAGDDIGAYVDLLARPNQPMAQQGTGSVHHIAFRTVDDAEQQEYLSALRGAGWRVTPVQDRQYFHSIYFRSPGGVLFEIATDAPGFDDDESIAELGTSLKLPAWLEPQRAQIEAYLPELNLPK